MRVGKQLLELGIEVHGETFDTGVCHIAFFTDPDGNRWSLGTYTGAGG